MMKQPGHRVNVCRGAHLSLIPTPPPSQGSPGHLDCNRRSASSLAPKSNYKVPVDGISSVGDVRLGMKPYISLGVSVTSMTFVGPLKNADPPLGLSPDICD